MQIFAVHMSDRRRREIFEFIDCDALQVCARSGNRCLVDADEGFWIREGFTLHAIALLGSETLETVVIAEERREIVLLIAELRDELRADGLLVIGKNEPNL